MDIDQEAQARIQELESLAEDQSIVIDLLQAEIEDLRGLLKAAKGQLSILKQDRRYEAA